jgi:hypothetical protein
MYPSWDPSLRLSRLGTRPNSQEVISVPQGNGTPGWIYLTRNPDPIAFWVNRVENANGTPLRIVMDDRCFDETIFRVERTSTHLYIADVWMWNGTPLFGTTTFKERQDILEKIYTLYTSCPGFETCPVQLRKDVKDVRGLEYYSNEKGARGIFVEHTGFEITKTGVPDVYRVSDGGYLRVKTLALSKHLRTLGEKFVLDCKKNEDGTWTPILSSGTLTNGSNT